MNGLTRLLAAATLAAAPSLILAASPPGAASCLGCHTAAVGDNPVPPLGALTAQEMVAAMRAFRSGERPATVMDRIAKGFSDEEIKAIAEWYARSEAE